jgi:hypothetical protein
VIASRRDPVVHSLYGIRIRTPWPVCGVPVIDGTWDVEFLEGDRDTLASAATHIPDNQSTNWAQGVVLPDGSQYRRWTDQFEFLVTPDARHIHARPLATVDDEAMLAYLLVDALSFSMVRLGWEPLHATAVATDRGVAAFLGNSGAGKSTLAAAFVQGGARLVTDDMLILIRHGSGWFAQPGPPRIKLYREMARRILGADSRGIPMNAVTQKLIIPLDAKQAMELPAATAALYILHDADEPATGQALIQPLSPARAFPAMLAHTAGHYPSEADRLRRQLEFAAHLLADVPVKTLSYPRDLNGVFRARDSVLADIDKPLD